MLQTSKRPLFALKLFVSQILVGSKDGKTKPAWVSWKDMTRPKGMGGLGFRDIELFNLALLARQGWRLLQNPTSLSARILKARYFKEAELLDSQLGSNPSQVWRGIHEGIGLLKQGLIGRIGTGQNTNTWDDDNLLPRQGSMRPTTTRARNAPSTVWRVY
jgi:hypothetical protein